MNIFLYISIFSIIALLIGSLAILLYANRTIKHLCAFQGTDLENFYQQELLKLKIQFEKIVVVFQTSLVFISILGFGSYVQIRNTLYEKIEKQVSQDVALEIDRRVPKEWDKLLEIARLDAAKISELRIEADLSTDSLDNLLKEYFESIDYIDKLEDYYDQQVIKHNKTMGNLKSSLDSIHKAIWLLNIRMNNVERYFCVLSEFMRPPPQININGATGFTFDGYYFLILPEDADIKELDTLLTKKVNGRNVNIELFSISYSSLKPLYYESRIIALINKHAKEITNNANEGFARGLTTPNERYIIIYLHNLRKMTE